MSDSVDDLRARLVKLDTEIILQRELLKKLEHDKSWIQRQLNAAIDPVARLPLEISSHIFQQALALCEVRRVPTVFLSVCHAWTSIGLATPALWCSIHICFPCDEDLVEAQLPIWFQRARNRPLSISISLRGRSAWSGRVTAVVWTHAAQLQHLEILDDDDFADVYEEDADKIDLFEDTTSITSLPLLETLTIRCQHRLRVYSGSQTLELLRRAPKIVECILDNVAIETTGCGPVVIPTLRRLLFLSGQLAHHPINDDIFRYLSLPALETLSLPMTSVTCEDLLAFVRESTPPLQNLDSSFGFFADSVHMLECLRLVPSLTRFALWNPDPQVVSELFVALVDSSLLPNLRDLTIDVTLISGEPPISEAAWRMLVPAVSIRRMRLYVVHVKISPPPDILVALQKLVADGLAIHIGTEEFNFVMT